MLVCLPNISPENHIPHALHRPDRVWPATNSVLDLWIELLHALKLPPEPLLSVAARQDFEGDQFGFTKPFNEDLEFLYGLRVQELSLYDSLDAHIARQIERGRLCLISADAYYLPDTMPASYRQQHRTTTIGVNRLDRSAEVAEYFHDGGYHRLGPGDFQNVLCRQPEGLQPLVEYTTLGVHRVGDSELRSRGKLLLARHWERRPAVNPIRKFQSVLAEQAELLKDREPQAFHDYTFNTFRMLGSNFDLLGACLDWLSGSRHPLRIYCARIAETAATMPLRLAKALVKGRMAALDCHLNSAAEAWDQLFESIEILAA